MSHRSLSRGIVVPTTAAAGAGTGTVTHGSGPLTANNFILGNGADDEKDAGYATVPIASGGTGQVAKQAAFDALSPLTTRGDLIVRDAANNVRFAKGATGKFLSWDANDPIAAVVPAFTFGLGCGGSFNPADATTYYISTLYGFAPGSADGPPGIWVPVACTLRAVYGRITVAGTLGSTETSSLFVRKNSTTDIVTVSTTLQASAAGNDFSATGLSVALAVADTLYLKWVCPTWVTNPTIVVINALLYCDVP